MKKIILFLLFSTLSFGSSLNGVFTELSGVYYDEISDDIKPRQINEHNESMCSLGISKDGEYFATGEPGVIHVWRVKDLKKIKDFYDQNSEEPYRCLNFSFNGNLLAAGSLNNSIKIFNINNGKLMNTFYGHTDTVTHVEFSPNGHLMVSSSDDGTIKIWDVVSGKELKSLKGHSTFVKTVIFTLDGKNLISAGNDRKIRVWDVSTGQQQKVLSGHEDCIFSLDLSSDGNLLASGDANGEIKIWDTLNWNEIASYSQGRSYSYNQQIEDLTFTADNKFIISGSQNGSLMFYDLRKKEVIKEIKNLTPVWSVKISPNFNTIISEDRYKMTLWELYKISYYIARANKDANLYDGYEEHLGILPKNTVVQLNGKKTEIIKPIEAIINSEDFEIFYTNKNNTMFYTVNDTTVYSDVNKIKNIENIEKGKVIKFLNYSYNLNLIYIDDGRIKGWIEPENIGVLKKIHKKTIVIRNNTISYESINGSEKTTYKSGDILEFDAIDESEKYYYSENIGWINKNDVIELNEIDKGKKIYSNNENTNFSIDLEGENNRIVSIGTEFELLGAIDSYYFVELKKTGEKGWILKSNMSLIKPDLYDPIVILTDSNIGNNHLLTIEGKVYDDTSINFIQLNGKNIKINPLADYDEMPFIPEVGYYFTTQWYLIEGVENNLEINAVDRSGKIFNKVLKYSPDLQPQNLEDFKLNTTFSDLNNKTNFISEIPKIEYSMELKDENNDSILSGSEKIKLIVKVVNKGEGEAKNIKVKINGANTNLIYKNIYSLGTLKSNETKIAVIEITGKNDNIISGKASFDLIVEEENGFNPFSSKFSFNVEPKLNPKLEILDYAIDDENKNGQIEQGEKFDLYVLAQNTGEGDSKNTIININQKANGIISMAETSIKIDNLKSGESKKVKFSFITNFLYKGNGDLPFDINFYNEKNVSKDSKSINLTMNKIIPTIKEVDFEAKKKEVIIASKISLMSDIDDTSKLISKTPSSKKWAVVIGIENYKKAPNVEYAERDALVTKEYFNRLLGVPKENTFYLSNSDATKTELETLLTSTLRNRVEKDDEVYFYFSGHGVPTNEGDSYLLLNDSDPATPQISAYSVKKLYEDLGGLKTLKSYAFLDTCFSGGVARGDEKESLLGGTRAIMKVKDVALSYNNLIVYAATGKDQLSNSFKNEGHGLFTYYLLKGLGGEADSDKDGKIGEQELQDYIKLNVTNQSRKLYGESRYQEPTLKSNGVETIITGDN